MNEAIAEVSPFIKLASISGSNTIMEENVDLYRIYKNGGDILSGKSSS